ncbi:hypothetical protein LTR24_001308 [Lithohypha guttulata]|uniref:Peptidase A1 domain-containing protein n=1 Tax=Lithohypha guttulata TaxID=1690604 RepID=A0ABR0KLM0_9EURO|nr:hypothetical protein LTR24_001308 [Lithohypha guttulata]
MLTAMIFLPWCYLAYHTFAENTGVHLPLYRRGGRLARHELANVTALSRILCRVEDRYARTYTDVDGNRVVRRWHDGPDSADDFMLDGAGRDGSWYTKLQVGQPPQTLEVDIDMLSPEFYTIMTQSDQGSKYDTFFSTTHVCKPPKYTHQTLNPSGTILGLSPPGTSNSLSRLDAPSFLRQLLNQEMIEHNIFSLTLLDSQTGILSLGSTIASTIEETKTRAQLGLKYLDSLHIPSEIAKMEEEIRGAMAFAIPPGSTHEHHFKWTDVGNGAVSGWHMTLMSGVWVDGVKVLRNQPVLLDINCPFILAPVGIIQTIYDSIPGARSLSSVVGHAQEANTEDTRPFYTFPCLNEIDIAFEIAGWRFPLARSPPTGDDLVHGPAGGRFGLGRVNMSPGGNVSSDGVSTGYCVGVIVETMMGVRKEWRRASMRDVWVLGEPFFRGLGVTVDLGDEKGRASKIGLRVY